LKKGVFYFLSGEGRRHSFSVKTVYDKEGEKEKGPPSLPLREKKKGHLTRAERLYEGGGGLFILSVGERKPIDEQAS